MLHFAEHLNSSPAYEVPIFLAPGSQRDHLWKAIPDVQKKFKPLPSDIIFLGGRDWEYLPKDVEEKNPVINVIQHVRHADPRYPFLSRKAHRICVSPEVAQSIQDTGQVNGPVDVLNIGLDPADIPNIKHKTADVFIAGLKARDLANGVRQRLEDSRLDVDCVDELIPRAQFLKRMASARIVLALPHETEGFFLPALEAMLAGCAVVCPDAVGNRGFASITRPALFPIVTRIHLPMLSLSFIKTENWANSLSHKHGRSPKTIQLQMKGATSWHLLTE